MLRPAVALVAAALAFGAAAAELHKDFVYLSDIDAAIRQDMRYAGTNNFTHAPLPGYKAAECVLTAQAAKALAAVQADLARRGYGLLVYDCYRPVKAVRRLAEWADKAAPADPEHNPHVARDRLIAEGYIARRSGHSAGNTVDLTLTFNGAPVDMGSGFDFFDPLSFTDATTIHGVARANRRRLVNAMQAHGFRNYRREWWHFTYARQPFAGGAFDFDIMPKGP